MTKRVEMGLRAVRLVAERTDPSSPVSTGRIAGILGIPLSSASRLCAELSEIGLLQRGAAYGTYSIGRRAVILSGRAAAPTARAMRYVLTTAAQATGETAFLAARTGDEAHIVAAVGSEWTLHASAQVGDVIDPRSAIASSLGPPRSGSDAESGGHYAESTIDKVLEIASPVVDETGECVAGVAVRLPVNRSRRGVHRARRAVDSARRTLEAILATRPVTSSMGDAAHPVGSLVALECAARILDHLASFPDSVAGTARAIGLRPDRTQRLIESCCRAGIVRLDAVSNRFELRWGVHAWHRAATASTLSHEARGLVAEAAADTGTYGFITILRGIRSFTVVEELGSADGGLVMMSWLGRPHPVIGSDGGPTLVMEFPPDLLGALLRPRHSEHDFTEFVEHVRTVTADGVLSMESPEEAGLISTSAPIYDASGAVAAAACLTGSIDTVRGRVGEVKRTTRVLAARISDLLGHQASPLADQSARP